MGHESQVSKYSFCSEYRNEVSSGSSIENILAFSMVKK